MALELEHDTPPGVVDVEEDAPSAGPERPAARLAEGRRVRSQLERERARQRVEADAHRADRLVRDVEVALCRDERREAAEGDVKLLVEQLDPPRHESSF